MSYSKDPATTTFSAPRHSVESQRESQDSIMHGIEQSPEGYTGLVNAILNNNSYEADGLILPGHNGAASRNALNFKNSKGETPLHFAVYGNKDVHITHALLEQGVNVNEKDEHGDTPLLRACKGRYWHQANILFEHADLEATDSQGMTAKDYINEYDDSKGHAWSVEYNELKEKFSVKQNSSTLSC